MVSRCRVQVENEMMSERKNENFRLSLKFISLSPQTKLFRHEMQRTLISRTLLRPLVRHSSTATISFAPSGSTSASTKVPYGDPSLASSAYLPAHPSSPSGSGFDLTNSATNETPLDLTPKQRTLLERIIRVDQAGELGANYIYQGQLAVLSRRKDKDVVNLVQVSSFTIDLRSSHPELINLFSTCGTVRRSTLQRLIKSSVSMEFDQLSFIQFGR